MATASKLLRKTPVLSHFSAIQRLEDEVPRLPDVDKKDKILILDGPDILDLAYSFFRGFWVRLTIRREKDKKDEKDFWGCLVVLLYRLKMNPDSVYLGIRHDNGLFYEGIYSLETRKGELIFAP